MPRNLFDIMSERKIISIISSRIPLPAPNMSAIFSKLEFPSTKVMVSTAASVAATFMVVRRFAKDFMPTELSHYLRTKFHLFLTTFSNEITVVIHEFDGLRKNHLFYAGELYVGSICSPSVKRYHASLHDKHKEIHVSSGGNQEIVDSFHGIQLKWMLVTEKSQRRNVRFPDDYGAITASEVRFLNLTFHKKHRDKVIDEYLPYVLEASEALKEKKKTLKLLTLRGERMHGPSHRPWQGVNLDHPAKFETLAMDEEMKKMIIDDLDLFLKRKELYRRVGKAWKRGYLLFGPPGTGKSSLIAAMANYLNFDVYDLELSDNMISNSELRRLVISTPNRSILVVEDIDASIDLSERKNKRAAFAKPLPPSMYPYQQQGAQVTLSGLLNFIDGLWSSCGDERIIVFTTNHKERLDPALLRPGRMDVHIHMSYCTPSGFKLLANNYLGGTNHPLVSVVEHLIASIKVTPAEVGEHLLKTDDPELSLQGLINFLHLKKQSIQLESEDGISKINELMKLAEALPADRCEEMLKKDEAATALKFLIGFLQQEAEDASGSSSESGL